MQRIFMFLVLFFFSNVLFAYKVETHVWIGQEVINDLEDGAVSINAGNQTITVPVRQEIVDAILLNKDSYRAGNIGPDAYPDIFTGQFVVHPGVEGSWNTDDWLKYLVKSENQSPEGTAFIYGYLGHAASDIFAHTYVNQYSGDIFDILSELENGASFNDAFIEEERHLELEKFIAAFNPPITNSVGSNLGAPHELIGAPYVFLRDRLIFNDEVALRNEAGSALHLSLAHKLRRELISFSENELFEMDKYVATAFVYYYSCKWSDGNFCYTLSNEEAEQFVEVSYRVHNIVQEYDPGQFQLENMQRERELLIGAVETVANVSQSLDDQLHNAINELYSFTIQLTNLEIELAQKIQELAQEEELLPGISCNWLTGCHPTWEPNPVYIALEAHIATLNAQKFVLEEELSLRRTTIRNVTEEITSIFLDAINIENTLFSSAVDFVRQMTSDVNIVRAYVDGWVRDIEVGMSEYMVTSELVIKDLMKSPEDGQPMQKLQNWIDCWGMAVAGVPSIATNATCSINDRIASINQSMDNIESQLLAINQLTNLVNIAKAKIDNYLADIKTELFYEVVELTTDIKLQRIIETVEAPASDARLNSIFGTDLSSNRYKGLLEISNMAERVKAEMNIQNGYFNATEYNPIRNSIMLAKLTLLDANGLNQFLSELTGSTLSLYDSNTFEQSNIMFGIARTIDGNHQWLEIAPPYPRREGFSDTGWPSQRRYGYQSTDSTGFKMWNYCVAKDQVFGNVFQGPLNLELYVPNYSEVLSSSYPYRPSHDIPYPSSAGNWSCGSGPWLISIITLIMN